MNRTHYLYAWGKNLVRGMLIILIAFIIVMIPTLMNLMGSTAGIISIFLLAAALGQNLKIHWRSNTCGDVEQVSTGD